MICGSLTVRTGSDAQRSQQTHLISKLGAAQACSASLLGASVHQEACVLAVTGSPFRDTCPTSVGRRGAEKLAAGAGLGCSACRLPERVLTVESCLSPQSSGTLGTAFRPSGLRRM